VRLMLVDNLVLPEERDLQLLDTHPTLACSHWQRWRPLRAMRYASTTPSA
jgi:hypothetical protein